MPRAWSHSLSLKIVRLSGNYCEVGSFLRPFEATDFRWKHPWQQSGKTAERYIPERSSINTTAVFNLSIRLLLFKKKEKKKTGSMSTSETRHQLWLLAGTALTLAFEEGVGDLCPHLTPPPHQVFQTNLKPWWPQLLTANMRKSSDWCKLIIYKSTAKWVKTQVWTTPVCLSLSSTFFFPSVAPL